MSLSLLSWRRTVSQLYRQVRASADPEQAHGIWRAGRDQLFRAHPDSPLSAGARARFTGIPVAPYDPALRFVVPVEPAEPAHLDVPTGTDGIAPFDRIGLVRLPAVGMLDVWWLGSYGGGVFVPFRDRSAGKTSYGGGRYLIDTVKGADLGGDAGGLVVDFNFGYHPSCAYDPHWACPLAPPGNQLDVELYAGELMPEGGWVDD